MAEIPDYIIVGAGSAGCVLARRLIDAGKRVTVLEAGGWDTNPIIPNVWEAGALWGGPEDWAYVTTEQEGCNNRRLALPRGKVLGGSHALNATIWVRGHARDYDTWEYLGCPGWGWDDVAPIFEQIEKYDGGDTGGRGTEGLLDVVNDFDMNPIQHSIIAAAEQWGLPINTDYNVGELDGVAPTQITVRDSKRLSTWKAYLEPIKDHENLTIMTDVKVTRMIVNNRVVSGLEIEKAGEQSIIQAGEIVLAAGTIGSAEILLRSGIGPAAELTEAGVDVVHDLPGVGKNLHDHLLSPVIFTTEKKPVPASTVGAAETHMFWKSSDDLAVPDTQPINFALPMYFTEDLTGPDNGFSLVAGIVRPMSRGELTQTGPSDPIDIDLGALREQADVDSLVASLRQCREIGRQSAFDEWGAVEVHPGPEVDGSDEALAEYARQTAVTYHHQVGTCKMGIDSMAVVNPRTFEVHGLTGLRIADASIMPTVTTGNTNAPTIMIAEKAAAVLATSDRN